MILAIDFDGVIHDIKNPLPGRRMGGPIIGAKEALVGFKREGHHIVIFTVRANSEASKMTVIDWLTYYEIPFDDVTNIKINADYYIDDKAIQFISWDDINHEHRI